MNSPFLLRAGAVAAQAGPDTAVAAHYGSPLPEQRALAQGRAIVDLSHLDVVEVRGEDRLRWLDSLTSQRIAGLAAGQSVSSLLLTPQGRIEFELGVLDDGERCWLITETGLAGAVAEFFTRMRFMLRVEVVDRSAQVFPVGSFGAHDLGSQLIWRDPWCEQVPGGVTYARAQAHPASSWHLQLHLLDAAGLTRAAQAEVVAGTDALEALRIAAWRPRQAREYDDRALPHEFDLLRSAVHLNKGCYRGQETVAKVHNLGHPPRRLARLDFDGETVTPGSLVYLPGDEKPVGKVTSSANHFEEGPIGLALLKRNTPQVQLEVGDARIAAAQTVIVPPEAGSTVDLSAFRGRH